MRPSDSVVLGLISLRQDGITPVRLLPSGRADSLSLSVPLGGTEAKKSLTFAVKARRLRARQWGLSAPRGPAPRPAPLPARTSPTPAPDAERSPSNVDKAGSRC